MSDKEIAEKIVENLGGKGNISSVRHCATRLRVMLVDKDKANKDAIENLDKVKGSFFNAGQFQIILGTGLVNRIHDEVIKITGGADTGAEQAPVAYGNWFQRAIRMFADVFVPIIPVLVATGLFMGLQGVLTQEAVLGAFGMTLADVPTELLTFTSILTDTAFAFLPALVCWSTFRNFGGNPGIGIVLGLMLVSPNLPNAYDVGAGTAEPMVFFGFLSVSGYQGSVLPAFVTGIIGAKFEQWLHKHVADTIDLIVVPFVTLLVGLALAIFAIGPALHWVETVVLSGIEAMLSLPFGLGGLIYGSLGQLLIIFGVHHVVNFLEISMLAATGWNMINPLISCGNMAQAGAVLAVGIRTKNQKQKQVAYPSFVSATLGITEPAVFGVNLPLIKPYAMALIGGAAGGWVASLLHLQGTGMAITGIPGTLLYLNEMLPTYLLVCAISFGTAFLLTFVFGFKTKKDKEMARQEAVQAQEELRDLDKEMATAAVQQKEREELRKQKGGDALTGEEIVLGAPVDGETVTMQNIPDPTFAQGILGICVGIEPIGSAIRAPLAGTITQVADTGHAVGMEADGMEILIHVGIDTVEMNGDGFVAHVHDGQTVQEGDLLLEADFKKVEAAGHAKTVIMAVTNSDDFAAVTEILSGSVQAGIPVLAVRKQA